MLRNLHIKNLALIREIDVDFTEGLNILTGETGAGKSVLVTAISTVLGDRADTAMVRSFSTQAQTITINGNWIGIKNSV